MSSYAEKLRLRDSRRARGVCIDCEASSPGFLRCQTCRDKRQLASRHQGPIPLSPEVEYALDLLDAASAGPRCSCGLLMPCNPETCPARKKAADYARSGLSTGGI